MAKRVLGKALYIEFRRETEVSQLILTPEIQNPIKDSRIKPYIITRNMRSDTKRRSWRYSSGPRIGYETTVHSMEEVFKYHNAQIRWITPTLIGYESGGWKVFKKPLVVEISSDDAIDIYDKKTPSALIRRIMKARADADFPAEIQVPLPYMPSV